MYYYRALTNHAYKPTEYQRRLEKHCYSFDKQGRPQLIYDKKILKTI